MRIKLVYPPQLHSHNIQFYLLEPLFVPSISLPVVFSFLKKKGYKVQQDDLDIKVHISKKKINLHIFDDKNRIRKFLQKGSDWELEEEAERILKFTNLNGFDIVGFSIMDEWNFASIGTTIVMSKLIKEKTGAGIAVGGVGAAAFLRWFSEEDILKFIDIYCPRPSVGHLDFYDVLLSMERKNKIKEKTKVKIFKDTYNNPIKNVIVNTKLVENFFPFHEFDGTTVEDLVPIPDFDTLPLELYKRIPEDIKKNRLGSKKILVLPYYFMIGCPNQCIFCTTRMGNFIFKDPQNVANDLEYLSRKYKTRFFIFFNPNVNPTRVIAEKFINAMKKKDLNLIWSDCANFARLDKKILKGLRDIGARRLILGVESPSPRMLKYIEKGTTISHIEKMLRLSDKLSIWNEIELISGLPHETKKDIQNTINFLRRNKRYINFVYLHKFKLHYSKLTENPEKYGITNLRPTNLSPGMGFDEINGLKWEEKAKEIEYSYELIKSEIEKLPNFGYTGKDQHVIKLFYLYSIFDDKKEILEYLQSNPFEAM